MFAIVHNHSRFTVLLLGTSFFLCPFLISAGLAGGIANRIAESVPAQIPEVITGGKWRKGNVAGYYRAMVVLPEAGTTAQKSGRAEVLIQWIGKLDGAYRFRILRTVNIKEVSKESLQHAFLSMDTLKDNEMTLLVSSFDAKQNRDISISVKATLPGQYRSGK